VTAGVAAALLAMLVKAETDNVVVARAKRECPAGHDDEALTRPAPGAGQGQAGGRVLKVHRITQAVSCRC